MMELNLEKGSGGFPALLNLKEPNMLGHGNKQNQSPLDIPDGQRRMGGNKELYLEVVSDFRKMYTDFPQRFLVILDAHTDLKAGMNEAAQSAHTLKGAAASISAPILRLRAAALEKGCTAGMDREEVLHLLEDVQSALKAVLDFNFDPA